MKFSLRLRMNKNLDPIAMPTTEIPVLSLSTTWRATAVKNLKQFSKKSFTVWDWSKLKNLPPIPPPNTCKRNNDWDRATLVLPRFRMFKIIDFPFSLAACDIVSCSDWSTLQLWFQFYNSPSTSPSIHKVIHLLACERS